MGTGFSEDDLNRFYEQFSPLIKTAPPVSYHIGKGIKPDFWVPPEKVWEIAFDSMTRSPLYRIGSTDSKGGISVRFPRMVRERTDKRLEDATTANEIIDMFEKTKIIPNSEQAV